MVRIWHVRQYETHNLISLRYKENAELWINIHQKDYNIKLDLVYENINESDLPPWSWILTMDFERERKGVLTDWDSETEGYED